MLIPGTYSQFNQHFTHSFCANILFPNITKPNCKQKKVAQNTFGMKKMLINVGEIDTLLTMV